MARTKSSRTSAVGVVHPFVIRLSAALALLFVSCRIRVIRPRDAVAPLNHSFCETRARCGSDAGDGVSVDVQGDAGLGVTEHR